MSEPPPAPDTQLVEFVRIGPDAFELRIGDVAKLSFATEEARWLANQIEAALGSAWLRTMNLRT